MLSGGRYDTLLEKYGRKLPAVGFSIKLDALSEIWKAKEPAKETVIVYPPKERVAAMKKARPLEDEGRVRLVADATGQELRIKEG